MPKIQIAPTVLAKTKEDFDRQLNIALKLSNRIQIDIADGFFVSNKTVSNKYIYETLKTQAEKLENTIFDFHLMVDHFEKIVEELEAIEQFININLVLPHYKIYRPLASSLHIGVVFSPDDLIDQNLLSSLPAIQIMTIEPGAQGNTFLKENLVKINEARKAGFEREILLDGGVNSKTLPIILKQEFVPDVLGVGSYIMTATDPKASYQELAKFTE
jgi:ribulose-phosphate 3-epimerase